MDRIAWNKEHYIMNGKETFLISGEFHYFRVPKADWRKRLELLKEAGSNCVATYIPWQLHEPKEGEFDFSSQPYLELETFLKLCKELEILVICRPGPYQYSELRYAGLPVWLIHNYPEIAARDIEGKIFNRSSISYLNSVFLDKVKTWFQQVCPIIARYTVENSGSVAFVQVDNELMGMHDWFGTWDYSKETMGIGQENGRYVRFLKERYKSTQKVNEAYGTAYASFTQVMPLKPLGAKSHGDLKRVKDYQDFYFSTISEYVLTLAQWVKENGIACDIIHNSAAPYMNGFFLETIEGMKDRFILGSDHYYNLDMDWEQNNPTPKYASKVYVSNEMLRNMGMPATVYEMPAGSGSDWPPITGHDLACCYMVNIAFGVKGINYYIFTGGPNHQKSGHTTDLYDYGAPISAEGEIRDSYYVLKEFHEFLHNHSWLAKAKMTADFNIAMDFNQSRSQFEKNKELVKGMGSLEVWSFLRKGIMITSLCSSYTPSLIDIEDAKIIEEIEKPLVIPASFCMSKKAQQNVIECIKNGGRVLITPCIPEMDENYQPCTLLKDFLLCGSVSPYTDIADNALRLNIGNIPNVSITGKVFKTDQVPEGAIVVEKEETYGGAVSWTKQYGAGTVIWLGFQWKFTQKEHMKMWKYILGSLGCEEPDVLCDNPNIWVVKRSDGVNEMLFVMNLFTSKFCANIQVKKDGLYKDIGLIEMPGICVKTIKI